MNLTKELASKGGKTKKKLGMRSCAICQKQFMPGSPSALYCSQSCKEIAKEKRNRERKGRGKSSEIMRKTIYSGLVSDVLEAEKQGKSYGRYKTNVSIKERVKHEVSKINAVQPSLEKGVADEGTKPKDREIHGRYDIGLLQVPEDEKCINL